MSLSPENKALVIRELGPIWAGLLDQDDKMNRLLDAARSSPGVGVEEVVEVLRPFSGRTVDFQGQMRFVGPAPTRADYARVRSFLFKLEGGKS